MRLALSTLAMLLVAQTLAGTVAVASDATEADAATQADRLASTEPAPQVWLKGAFGTVAGSDRATPAGATPDDTPLDAWMRRAPLLLEIDAPAQDVLGFTVVATSGDGGGESGESGEPLSQGAAAFAGPDAVGTSVVVATVEMATGPTREYAWLLEVPERESSEEALFDIVGPDASLSSAGHSVTGVPGHGCYAYLCVEAGRRPPRETLTPLRVAIGGTPWLHLSDGSAMVGWSGTLWSVDQDAESTRTAVGAAPDGPVVVMALHGLEPPAAGEWWLELRVDYDRERGWQWFFYRLSVE